MKDILRNGRGLLLLIILSEIPARIFGQGTFFTYLKIVQHRAQDWTMIANG